VVPQSAVLEGGSKKDGSRLDRSSYKLVLPGDIAYNKMRAWQGAIGVSNYRGIVSPAYIVQRPRCGHEQRFFHYLFRTPAFAKEAERWSYGITSDMWSLRPEHFKMIYVCLPPPEEQAAIVRYLDYMDRRIRRYIRAKEKLIKLLEEQKQAIIHHAVTRGLDPNVPLKPSGIEWLGDIPEHWEVRKLGMLGTFIKGRGIARADIADSGIPAITYGDIYTQYTIETKALKKFTTEQVAAGACEIQCGDLLFTASGETIEEIGKTVLYSGDTPAYAGGDIIILRLKHAYGLYLSYFLNSKVGCKQKSSFGRGDIIVHISATKLKQVVVLIPPLNEQATIAEFLDQNARAISAATVRSQRQITLLREYRTRIIADVVTGKLDVRGASVEEIPEDEALDALPPEEDDLGEEHDMDESLMHEEAQ
jgi:type I restriction enzyme S subunit